ncbi:MAG: hypothetical protein ABUL48_03400 [Pseudorhodoplanes sp.]
MAFLFASHSRAHLQPGNAEIIADSARLALACTFSSSDEFESAVISERRAEGAYGPTTTQRLLALSSALGLVLVLLLAIA